MKNMMQRIKDLKDAATKSLCEREKMEINLTPEQILEVLEQSDKYKIPSGRFLQIAVNMALNEAITQEKIFEQRVKLISNTNKFEVK